MTVAEFESIALTLGVGALIAYMLYIIFKLGQESKGGKFAYFVLFGALGLGLFGFIAKLVIQGMLEH